MYFAAWSAEKTRKSHPQIRMIWGTCAIQQTKSLSYEFFRLLDFISKSWKLKFDGEWYIEVSNENHNTQRKGL
jgi:hypothetical protein